MSISKASPRPSTPTCCAGRLAPVLDTLHYLVHETSVWVEITTLLIPGRNDSDEELDRLTRWVVHELGPDVPLHFSAFHPDYKLLDVPPTPPATLAARARHRPRQRCPLRLHGQRDRPRWAVDRLPRLRRAPHRTRLVRARSLPRHRRRPLQRLRHPDPRRVLRARRPLGLTTPAGADRGLRGRTRSSRAGLSVVRRVVLHPGALGGVIPRQLPPADRPASARSPTLVREAHASR